MNTEIGKTGEVIVEGHAIGRLDGFTFAPDAAEAGSDAKALQAAAQQVLAGEIDARAEKLAAAPDDAVRADVRRHHPLDRRCGRQAGCRRRGAASAAAHHRRRAADGCGARSRADPARSVAEDAYRKAAGAAVRAGQGRGRHRHRARHRVPADRGARRAGARQDRRRDEGSRPAVARSLRKYGVRFGAYHIYFPRAA